MKIRFIFLCFLICFQTVLLSQTVTPALPNMHDGLCENCPTSTPINNAKKGSGTTVFDGNENIATSYTATACGLNYISASFNLDQRDPSNLGVAQPAAFVVSGIPVCGRIFKAFLYSSCENDGTVTTLTPTIINPAFNTFNFPMTVIGTGASKCWSRVNSLAFRADITNAITGNGTYFLSGFPVTTGSGTDVNGASLFIIYTDENQGYTGSIVIADGMMTNVTNGDPVSTSISGFQVCATPSVTTNFLIVDDAQNFNDIGFYLNSATPNYTAVSGSQAPWMLISQPGANAVAGQTSATYGVQGGSDCLGVIAAGMYYRNNCLGCTIPMTVTPSSQFCTNTATVIPLNGVKPFTYTWTGSASTTSAVTGLSIGNHTVTVSDTNGCKTASAVINIKVPTVFTINSATICPGLTATLSGGPATSSYTWSPGATLNTVSGASVIANPTITTLYTINSTNSLTCPSTNTAQVFVYPVTNVTINSPTTCPGISTVLTATPTGPVASYTWSPGATLNTVNGPTVIATPTVTTIYTIDATSSSGCITTYTTQVFVYPITSVALNSPSTCPGVSTTLIATPSGPVVSYTWGPGANLNTVNGAIVISTPNVTTNYTVTATNSYNCINTYTTQVFVYPAATVTLNNVGLCIGYSTTLSASPEASYTWSPAGGLSSTSIANPVANPVVTSTYNVAYTSPFGCLGSQTVQVLVGTTQTVSIANETTCVGQNFVLTPNNAYTGASYVWVGPNSYTSSAVSPTVANPSLAASGIYSLTLISVAGCTSSAFSSATVFPVPSLTITSNSPVCAGTALSFTGSGAVTYSWAGPSGYTATGSSQSIPAAPFSADGIYTLTGAFSDGCASMITQSLQVKGLPVPAVSYNATLCATGTLTLFAYGGDTYNWTGPNGFSSSLQFPTIPNVTAAAGGVYSLAISAVGCAGSNTTIAVVVHPLPTPSAVNNSPICEGASLQLTAFGSLHSFWQFPNGSTSNQNFQLNPCQLTDAGIYTLTATDVNGCQASVTTTVTILAKPIIVATGTNVCYGASGTLTITSGSSYNWKGPNGFLSTIQHPTVTPVDNNSSGIYTVIVTAANTCTNITTASLGTIPLPVVVPISTLACDQSIATLTASGANSYTWVGPNSYNSTGSVVTIPITNSLSIGIYTIIATGLNTCTITANASLGSIPLPTVNVSQPIYTVCLHEPIVLVSSGTMIDTTVWFGPGGFISGGPNATISAANSVPVTTYTVLVTAPNTCTQMTTADLVTIPLPIVVATSSIVCYESAFTITVTGSSTSYVWKGPKGYTTTGPTASIPFVDSTWVGTYSVVGTDAATTCSFQTTAFIQTMPLPTIIAVSPKVCLGKSSVLKASGGIQSGYYWSGPTSGQGSSFLIPVVDPSTRGTYTVIGTAVNTCTNDTTTFLDFYNPPVPVIISPTSVCIRSSITLQGFGAKTYTWTGPYNYFSTFQNVTIPIFNMNQAGTYTLTETDTSGCVAMATSPFITINPAPTGTLVSDNNANFCVPYCSTYRFDNRGASPLVNISWLVNSRIFNSDTFNYCATNVMTNYALASFTDALGCTNTASFALVANPTPVADFIVSPEKPTESLDEVIFTNASVGDRQVQWNWYFMNNDGFSSSSKNTSFLFNEAGTYPVAMVVTNFWGCADTVIKNIVIASDVKLYVPDAFTPNGDGLNDVFQPKGRGIQKYTLTIYDRWANVIFQTNNFTTGWDGTRGGSSCPLDVYVWKINVTDTNGKIQELTGHVVLVN